MKALLAAAVVVGLSACASVKHEAVPMGLVFAGCYKLCDTEVRGLVADADGHINCLCKTREEISRGLTPVVVP